MFALEGTEELHKKEFDTSEPFEIKYTHFVFSYSHCGEKAKQSISFHEFHHAAGGCFVFIVTQDGDMKLHTTLHQIWDVWDSFGEFLQ